MNGPRRTARLIAGLAGTAVLALTMPAAASAQEGGPLLKSDLVRMMTASNHTATEMAAIVRMNCVSFEPTARDRDQLGNLPNADVVLDEVDRCMSRSRTSNPAAAADGASDSGADAATDEVQVVRAPPRPSRRNIDLDALDIDGPRTTVPELKRPDADGANRADADGSAETPGSRVAAVSSELDTPPALENWQEVSRALLGEYRPNVRHPGSVLVWLQIGPDGRVVDGRIKRNTGDPALAEAVMEITSVMEFTPATRDGRPVESWTELPINLNSN